MPASNSSFTILRAARLIDGNGGPAAEQAAILLEGDSIRQIGTAETVQAPEGAPVQEFDYGDATIMPGLVDSHVHLIGIGDGRAGTSSLPCPTKCSRSRPLRMSVATFFRVLRQCAIAERRTAPRSRYGRRSKWAFCHLPGWYSREGRWLSSEGISATSASRPLGRTSAARQCASWLRKARTSSRSPRPAAAHARATHLGHRSTWMN